MTCRLIFILAAVASLALAQDGPPAVPASPPVASPVADPSPPPADPAKPRIRQLDATHLQIGQITLDQKSREIRFPAKVNMAKGLLEYLVCLQQGKVHEALLITEISPTHLNLAFTLLRYPASQELFYRLNDAGEMTEQLIEVAAPVKAGARIAIEVEWSQDGKTRRQPVNDWIQHAVKTTAMAAGPWLYSGSYIFEGKYVPEGSGDIAAIMVVPGALINYPGSDNGDNVWFSYPKRVPPEGTPVTVIISPYSNSQPLPPP